MERSTMRGTRLLVLASVLTLAPQFAVAERVDENPGGFKMMADLLVARPLGLVVVGVSTAAYVVSLPVSMMGGNAEEAGRKMVVEPAREVFVRCLGCSRPGRKEKIRD
ncbi:MAG: hypothetical protein O2780_06030 [Proteobacteria bacterium]|nr:hypothetical protein [Pseudomonadota bacterium]MDA1300729.1 hypothetical protein [Pseudomonadota bacterium]